MDRGNCVRGRRATLDLVVVMVDVGCCVALAFVFSVAVVAVGAPLWVGGIVISIWLAAAFVVDQVRRIEK